MEDEPLQIIEGDAVAEIAFDEFELTVIVVLRHDVELHVLSALTKYVVVVVGNFIIVVFISE